MNTLVKGADFDRINELRVLSPQLRKLSVLKECFELVGKPQLEFIVKLVTVSETNHQGVHTVYPVQ